MTGSDRRKQIVDQIRNSTTPVAGKVLAAAYDVSRQVIVQDIALIRAAGYDIISTNRGYIINEPAAVSRVYGHMEAEINITSRRKVTEFMDDIQNGKSSPLKNITSDYHYHKVEADSEETLDLIEDMLRNKGFLVEDRG